MQAELASARLGYSLICEASEAGIWDWDMVGGRMHSSARLRAMFGLREEDELGDPLRGWSLVHPEDQPRLQTAFEAHILGATPVMECDVRGLRADGEPLWLRCRAVAARDEAGAPVRIAGSVTDLADRRTAEERARHAALHDPLTGLPNRAGLLARLERCIRRARRDPAVRYAALYLDIDRFKRINDGLGHTAGDELLRAFADRILLVVRTTDTLGRNGADPLTRLGGDEFVLLLEDFSSDATALRVAERVIAAVSTPFAIAGRQVHVACSVGIVMCAGRYASAEDVLRDAHLALHHAKTHGRGRFEVFDAAVHAATLLRWQLEGDMRAALGTGQFFLEYQPVVCLHTGRVVSVEALVRWRHPRLGRIAPNDFIPLAEETGLIVALGLEVFGMAARDLRAWRELRADLAGLRVAVNVSPRQMSAGGLAETFEALLTMHGLPGEAFDVEITESVLMDAGPDCLSELGRLRALGMRLHLDDFGTGYCSLAYLRRVRVDALKIDRSFVVAMEEDPATEVIVRAIVSLARGFGSEVLAEGVETRAQLARMAGLGCDLVQGYVYHRPMPAADLLTWLERPPTPT